MIFNVRNSMGVDFHITRAEFWAYNEHTPITAEEWLECIQADPELELFSNNGTYYARWLGASAHEEPWLDWSSGDIWTKWPDTALYLKMLEIAKYFGATVQDDDGTVYALPTEYEYDPNVQFVLPIKKKPWWQFW